MAIKAHYDDDHNYLHSMLTPLLLSLYLSVRHPVFLSLSLSHTLTTHTQYRTHSEERSRQAHYFIYGSITNIKAQKNKTEEIYPTKKSLRNIGSRLDTRSDSQHSLRNIFDSACPFTVYFRKVCIFLEVLCMLSYYSSLCNLHFHC